MPSPSLGHRRKHANHIALLEQLVADGTVDAITKARSLQDLYRMLLRIPSFGSFLAYQYAIDLNYSPHFPFDEMEFVVAGPRRAKRYREVLHRHPRTRSCRHHPRNDELRRGLPQRRRR